MQVWKSSSGGIDIWTMAAKISGQSVFGATVVGGSERIIDKKARA
jgi:hypothetical protein